MKTFEAIYMPGGEGINKGGFKTEQDAWDYIVSRNCDGCKKEGISSMCSAEWEVDVEELSDTDLYNEKLKKKTGNNLNDFVSGTATKWKLRAKEDRKNRKKL